MTEMRPPLIHQAAALEASLDRKEFALFFEQRCGKTFVIIKTALHHWKRGTVDGAIIIAWPNGVQNVWAEEWPKDWPEDEPYKLVAWRSGKMDKPQAKQELAELLNFQGFAVLAMNCEAMLTASAWTYISKFFRRRKVLVTADESSWAKSPNAARTKRLLALGHQPSTILKRILDGTPADEGPLDLWAPCAFLDPRFLGYSTFFGYRAHYCQLEDGYAPGGRTFKKVAGWRNLDELNQRLAKFSMRVRRADVSDAPPKVYQSRYFQMTDTQRRVYDRLRDEYIADLSGGELSVANVLKRMIRLQMVARNYYPPEEGGRYCSSCGGNGEGCEECGGLGIVVETTAMQRIDPDENPAQGALAAELKQLRKPSVIWCRFRQDVTDAMEASLLAGRKAVRYDGTISAGTREEALRAFKAGGADDIIATIGSGLSRGRDLTIAGTIIYYSNDFSLRARRQSEDRAESLSRDFSTDVIDLIAEDTRDIDNIQALRDKRSIAEMIVGDPAEKWI